MSTFNPMDIPLYPPPPGVTSNFENPETRAPLVVSVSAVALGLMWSVFLLRVYSKAFVARTVSWDDAAAVLAAIGATAFAAGVIWEMKFFGAHGWDIRAFSIQSDFEEISVAISELCFGPTIFFAKLALFLLYLRVFGPNRLTRLLVYIGIGCTLVVYLATTIAFGVLCVRRPGETWAEDMQNPRCLRETGSLNYIQGIFGLVSDIYLFILPLPPLLKLQMPKARKVGVIMIFATASLAIIASVFGLYCRLIESLDVSDPAWDLPMALLLAVVEMNVGIICSSMPYLPSLFRKYNIETKIVTSVRYLFSRTRRSTRGKNSEDSTPLNRLNSNPRGANAYVETKVLGSVSGNGRFLKTGDWGRNPTTPHSTLDSATGEAMAAIEIPTRRDHYDSNV